MMKSNFFSQRLKTLISTFVVMLAATASLVATPVSARAEEPTYNENRIEASIEGPGFKWVERAGDTPAHYEISNEFSDYPESVQAASGWYYFAQASREYDFSGYLVMLADDINFSGATEDLNSCDEYTVGSEDRPFKGTFDGGDHTLSGFRNERDGLLLQLDCGFFGWTRDAAIKNVKFKDCYVGATFRGGLVAGYAQDTFFLNITCEDCTTSVIPGNNVVNLITNAGLAGGMIAGETNGSTLYNCEVVAGGVVTNATSGVGALGGQPLYLGGLVGAANDTVIEYCRVTDKWVTDNEDNKVREYCDIQNKYGTAVSVANYSEVFTGGIVGMMQGEDTGSKIVDCYSTADVYSEASIYFAVGLGLGVTRGYTGGIAGIVRGAGDGVNLIERVSYAGNLHSRTWNVLLLGIPIIEYDSYMGGITGRGGDNCTINQAYYLRSASSTKKDFYAVKTTYDGGYSNGAAYGPRDENYTDRKYWEGCGFDFAKGTIRNLSDAYQFTAQISDSEWSRDHYNKWVMDYNRGIPVHGGSIKATFDFPNSGEVTIGYTSMAWNLATKEPGGVDSAAPAQTTTNSFDFAVQGYEQNDKEITLRYKLHEDEADKNESWKADSNNEGYRIMGWYGARNVKVNAIPSSHNYFTSSNTMLDTDTCGKGLLSDGHLIVANEEQDAGQFDLTVEEPAGDEASNTWSEKEYEDNDLYVARAEAQVLLHDVNGNIIKKDGTAESPVDKSDDWYGYEATPRLPETVAADNDNANLSGANFIGWTTQPNSSADGHTATGYTAIDSSTLASLKENNKFWEPGDVFSVTEPVNLYPVYSKFNNITVIYEGHENDTNESINVREDYGQAVMAPQDDGTVKLSVQPSADSPLLAGTNTVRFLGWYEYVGEKTDLAEIANDNTGTDWLRVSRGAETADESIVASADCFEYTLSSPEVDLTDTHIYKARFEYEVSYYAAVDSQENDKYTYEEYASLWHLYQQEFMNIAGPNAGERPILHWAEEELPTTKGLVGCSDDTDAFRGVITYPVQVIAHYDSNTTPRQIVVNTDFPTGPEAYLDEYESTPGVWNARISIETAYQDEGGQAVPYFNTDAGTDQPYWFHGWTGENDYSLPGRWQEESTSTSWDEGLLSNYSGERNYWYEAHVTAKVTFHGVPTQVDESLNNEPVKRRFEQDVFLASECNDAYTYHYTGETSSLSSTNEAFPFDTDMSRSGYIFLGWLDLTDPEVEDALSRITVGMIGADTSGENGNAYIAKSKSLVEPYLMTGKEVCTRPMELYPVYIGFDVETTTNIYQAEVDDSIYNIPTDPVVTDGEIDGAVNDKFQLYYNDDNGNGEQSDKGVDGLRADGELPEGAANPVEITYIENGEALIDITVDRSTKVWNDEESEDAYVFESLTVSRDGEVVDTLLPGDDFNGTFADYEILAGYAYEFMANYSPVPVMVTYHLGGENGDDIDSISTEVGSLLPSTTKTPWFNGYDNEASLGDNEFFVGWTVGESTGEVVDWASEEDPVLAKPGVDTVTGTTHLWPVYRKSAVTPVSNIDSVDGVGTSHRRATKHANDTSTLWLEADEVPGYEFKGWSKDYVDGGEGSYSLFTTSAQTALTGDARFDTSVTYTAIYDEVAAQVRYHDIDGAVIYTASVAGSGSDGSSDPAADPNRSFVYQMDLGSGEQTWAPIDTEAFTAIAADVAQRNENASDGTYMEFVTWQLIGEGEPQRWGSADVEGSFVTTPIKDLVQDKDDRVLDLYPVVAKIKASDASGSAYSALTPQLVLDTQQNKITAANITLKQDYGQEYLKVHIDEVAYAPAADGTSAAKGTPTPLTDIPVKLYGLGSSMDEPMASDKTRAEDNEQVTLPSGETVTIGRGDAIFTFTGFINIQKRTTDANAAGKTFSFIVTSSDEPSATRRVTVKVSEEAVDGYYSGSARVALPFGAYKIAEDDNWAWRYTAQLDKWAKNESGNYVWVDADNNAEVRVTYTSEVTSGNPDGATSTVRATNTRTNNKWSDGSDYRHNVFNDSVEGGN